MDWSGNRAGVELPRRQRGGDHALSRSKYRSGHDGYPALGIGFLRAPAALRCAQMARADFAVAALGFYFFGVFFVPHIAINHDDARASLYGTPPLPPCWRGAWCRGADDAKVDRCRRRACRRTIGGARGAATDHDGRRAVHGLL